MPAKSNNVTRRILIGSFFVAVAIVGARYVSQPLPPTMEIASDVVHLGPAIRPVRDLGFVIRTIAISRYPEHFSESELLSAAPGMRGVSDVDDRATSPLSSDPASPTSSGKAESRSSAVLPLPLRVCANRNCGAVRASSVPLACPICGSRHAHTYLVDAQLVSKGDF